MEEKICIKCGSEAKRKKFDRDLCEVCYHFSPDNEHHFDEYIKEKVDGKVLETFRKYSVNSGARQKRGMVQKASSGNLMSRVPFGYKVENKKLVPAVNYKEVEEIFEDFLSNNISLRQLSSKHNLSVNGLKKILKNYTYIGKVKFNGQTFPGSHQPIISTTLFNHVQNKLEQMKIKK